jgi:hypothetical protein
VLPMAHRATKATLVGLALIWLVAQLTNGLIEHFRMPEPTARSAPKGCDCLRIRARQIDGPSNTKVSAS